MSRFRKKSTVRIILLRSQRLTTYDILADPSQLLQFFTSLLQRLPTDKAPDAHVMLLATLAHAKLLYGDLDGTKKDMDEAWKVLDELPSVDNKVRAAYYKVAADYYKVCPLYYLC